MKVAIHGYGSIGKKHHEVFLSQGCQIAIVSRQSIQTPNSFADAASCLSSFNPDLVLIATPTHQHAENLINWRTLGFKGVMLVEKPLFAEIPAGKINGENIFVAYNLRFHPLIQQLKAEIEGKKILSAIFYVGQYLPQWRPGTDYSQSYSADSARGGGVVRDLSHEIDLALYLLGPAYLIAGKKDKVSDLKINSEDVCTMLLKTKAAPHCVVHMNYLDQVARRFIRIITEHETYEVDLVNSSFEKNSQTVKFEFPKMISYQLMAKALYEKDYSILASYQQGLDVLELITQLEKASI